MRNAIIVVVVLVVVVLAGIPLLSHLTKETEEPGAADKTAPPAKAQQPAPKPADTPPPPPPPPAPPQPVAGPAIDAQTIVGTMWLIEGYTLEFQADGKVLVYLPGTTPGPQVRGIPGTWTINGTTITASALGQSITGQISGNQIMGEKGPIQRLK